MPNAKEKITHIVQTLQNVPEIKNIYLFGSRARGDATPRSDIDLAIESEKPLSIRKQRRIKEMAEAHSGLFALDIVFLHENNTKLKKIIDVQGIKLYEKK